MPIEITAYRFKNLSTLLDQVTCYFLLLTGFFVPLSITATDICMATTAILGILSGRFFHEFDSIKRNAIVWCAVWIVVLVVLSMLWSIAGWHARLSALHKYGKLLYIPFLLAVCTDPKWRERTVVAFLVGVLIIVVLSYLKAWTGLHVGRNPNPAFIFYTHIETGFLVAFASYLLALTAWKKPRWRVPCLILLVIFTYQEFFINDGRTGWVAYLILILLFAIQWGGWKGLFAGIAVAVLLSGAFYYTSPTLKPILEKSRREITLYYQGQQQTSLGYRLSFNSLGWRLVKKRPWLGYGAGSFAAASKELGGVPGWKVIQTPHNEYLLVTVEFGLVGLLSLLTLFGSQWAASFRLGETKYFAQGLVLVFMVSAFYNAFLYSSVSGHFFVLFTSLFFGQYRHDFSWKPGVSGRHSR